MMIATQQMQISAVFELVKFANSKLKMKEAQKEFAAGVYEIFR